MNWYEIRHVRVETQLDKDIKFLSSFGFKFYASSAVPNCIAYYHNTERISYCSTLQRAVDSAMWYYKNRLACLSLTV